ncbi:hypothetical protein AWB67_05306 [Caballeronia terrestris]|uniref:DUF1488 domain-containing protein n=1 Tax=Caballeronia terrestris TaxID=1226301 RepID=A0A158KD32_9BURK|nr:DUF1488 family protein [Caballeronia terrestris]SAL78653.1 hypothetical protein AWB67_05306 [Caballeronia terrestris]
METLDLEPRIAADHRSVVFVITHKTRAIECVVARAALETHFWLTPDANDTKTLKTFHDGYRRIQAVAQRKLLAHPTARLELTAADFVRSEK